ncbi:hypothetical protein M2271_005492 [Streptomyces sp. LBL]|uniref:hypothetical protein n=1 Tax=Streptomyces sp. LBL TaxID=2940562 RepID=UPI00247360FD|nr:hypothetical protein [Streptomyces sp. LBL]MDH6627665.1 hypothetical protein [Streptomyces sp. LBL]
MRGKRTTTGAAVLVGALAVTGLAFAPTASAVAPTTATITASCGAFGGGAATLTATQNGTSATMTLSSTAITTPLALAKDSITAKLTMVRSAGGTVLFSGKKNPAIPAGGSVTVGPLNGTVTSGDRLEFFGGSLQMTVFGISVSCTASANQSPGPFVYN